MLVGWSSLKMLFKVLNLFGFKTPTSQLKLLKESISYVEDFFGLVLNPNTPRKIFVCLRRKGVWA